MKIFKNFISSLKYNWLKFLFYIFILIYCIILWYYKTKYIDLEIAWRGVSPIEWIYKVYKPENFLKDYPSGAQLSDKSAFMHIYKILYKNFNISPERVLPFIIGLEIFSLAFVIIYLTKNLLPNSSPFVWILVSILVIGSYAGNINLARYATPFFVGEFYTIAECFRLLAIIMFLKEQYFISAIFIALCFITHPVQGLIGIVFIFFMLIYIIFLGKKEVLLKILKAYTIFIPITVSWVIFKYPKQIFINNIFPEKEWISLAKLFSCHFYPVEMGLFTVRHTERFIPFLSFLLLLTYYLYRTPESNTKEKVIFGLIGMIILTILGIIISAFSLKPTLIKLTLHRASQLIFFIGIIYVINGVWDEIENGEIYKKVLALLIIISPLVFSPGFPILYSLALVLSNFIGSKVNRFKLKDYVFLLLLLFGITILFFIYLIRGLLGKWYSPAYTGGLLLIKLGVISYFAFLIVFYFKRDFYLKFTKIFILTIFIIFSGFFIRNQIPDTNIIKRNTCYKEVQEWAKLNTKFNSLFMVDPTIYYGWRDFSQRSSFGNLREWLYPSWGYESDFENYKEGRKRFNELKIDLNKYLNSKGNSFERYAGLYKEVQEKFYSMDDRWRIYMSKKYGIDYFVLMKERLKNKSNLKIAYENEHFIVLKSSFGK